MPDDADDTAVITLAQKRWAREGVEIDNNAPVSHGDDNGAYVQAWVWVDFTGTPLDKSNTTESHEEDL